MPADDDFKGLLESPGRSDETTRQLLALERRTLTDRLWDALATTPQREKLVRAVRAACHKRPVDIEQITMLVEDVVDALEAQFENEIPSRAIGEGVMQRLRHVDQVAYVRFASIYKQFRDVAEFVDEVSALSKKRK